MEPDEEQVVEWREMVEGVLEGPGHFIGLDREGNLVQAHFVNVGSTVGGRHSASSGTDSRLLRTWPDRPPNEVGTPNLTDRR